MSTFRREGASQRTPRRWARDRAPRRPSVPKPESGEVVRPGIAEDARTVTRDGDRLQLIQLGGSLVDAEWWSCRAPTDLELPRTSDERHLSVVGAELIRPRRPSTRARPREAGALPARPPRPTPRPSRRRLRSAWTRPRRGRDRRHHRHRDRPPPPGRATPRLHSRDLRHELSLHPLGELGARAGDGGPRGPEELDLVSHHAFPAHRSRLTLTGSFPMSVRSSRSDRRARLRRDRTVPTGMSSAAAISS